MDITDILLLASGAFGAACGWSFGSRFVGRPTHRSFDPLAPKIWRFVLAAAFAFAFVALVSGVLAHFGGI
ncbi:hypothetical protein [Enhydrobacter sp.]|jgi:hypothetical protein|uniref:hypothetical protein n=1 Tax=Enhydrobacter sp. TaxID=1894999 RepID=UPI0026244D60|nr:hypothetical protein [Enhydrobacter sp.]WIM10739.1 MAG: hypothetical protein OJF58_001695 [Enhydrobacter sp.]